MKKIWLYYRAAPSALSADLRFRDVTKWISCCTNLKFEVELLKNRTRMELLRETTKILNLLWKGFARKSSCVRENSSSLSIFFHERATQIIWVDFASIFLGLQTVNRTFEGNRSFKKLINFLSHMKAHSTVVKGNLSGNLFFLNETNIPLKRTIFARLMHRINKTQNTLLTLLSSDKHAVYGREFRKGHPIDCACKNLRLVLESTIGQTAMRYNLELVSCCLNALLMNLYIEKAL